MRLYYKLILYLYLYMFNFFFTTQTKTRPHTENLSMSQFEDITVSQNTTLSNIVKRIRTLESLLEEELIYVENMSKSDLYKLVLEYNQALYFKQSLLLNKNFKLNLKNHSSKS